MFYQLTIQTRNNGEVGELMFVFGHDAADLDELFDHLKTDGFLRGRRYETRPSGPGLRRVRRSSPCLLSKGIVLQVIPLPETLSGPDGDTLYVPDAAHV